MPPLKARTGCNSQSRRGCTVPSLIGVEHDTQGLSELQLRLIAVQRDSQSQEICSGAGGAQVTLDMH